MKRKSLLTNQQEELLKKFNKNFKTNENLSLSENENIKKENKFVKTQFHRGANRGR